LSRKYHDNKNNRQIVVASLARTSSEMNFVQISFELLRQSFLTTAEICGGAVVSAQRIVAMVTGRTSDQLTLLRPVPDSSSLTAQVSFYIHYYNGGERE